LTTLHAALKVLGYDGSHGRVAAYIRERSRLAGTPSSAVFSPLRFAPGEAFQFDFGTETVELDISSYRMNFPPSL
jgi:hypothetical protein